MGNNRTMRKEREVAATMLLAEAGGLVDAEHAKALQAAIEYTKPLGQGTYNLLVPQAAVEAAGLKQKYWEMAGKRVLYKNKPYYEIPYDPGVTEFLDLLKTTTDARWVQKHQASKASAQGRSGVVR